MAKLATITKGELLRMKGQLKANNPIMSQVNKNKIMVIWVET